MIQNYLISNCLIIIEDLNQRFERFEKEEIRQFANTNFDESDLVFLIAYPFRNLMKVSMQGKNEDIKIKNLDFVIEVKYLYATKSGAGNYTNKRSFFESFEKDFTWLTNEINNGNKGKRAFIIGWFNVYDSFSNLMQLGNSAGNNPKVNLEKINYFPFLSIPKKDSHVSDVKYRYQDEKQSVYNNENYIPYSTPVPDLKRDNINCIFLGKETDKFNFAIYY